MRVGVLGTGNVGRELAGRLASAGHDVTIGTRDVEVTMARTSGGSNTPPLSEWLTGQKGIRVATLQDAAADAELIVNAVNGESAIAALETAGEQHLSGKVLLDVSNALDFSDGFPPKLTYVNTDSLGEQIQRRFPEAKVVKSLNTMNNSLMLAPGDVAGGDHSVFVAGNDAEAKATVTKLLQSFGWTDVLDLGDISGARGAEMMLPVWLQLAQALGTMQFQFKIAR